MNNMLELPKRKDFHNTTIVEFANNSGGLQPLKLSETIQYRKGFVNMRNVVDLFEMALKFEVIDETKIEEYEKQKSEWIKKHQPHIDKLGFHPSMIQYDDKNDFSGEVANENPEVPPFTPPPPMPKTIITIPVSVVLYFNGVQRMMVDDIKEFSELYFDYLQEQKLDL